MSNIKQRRYPSSSRPSGTLPPPKSLASSVHLKMQIQYHFHLRLILTYYRHKQLCFALCIMRQYCTMPLEPSFASIAFVHTQICTIFIRWNFFSWFKLITFWAMFMTKQMKRSTISYSKLIHNSIVQ